MPYSQFTLDQIIGQVGTLLDDPSHLYWTEDEIELAVDEGLLYWGALTSYWRSRGAFNISPSNNSPFYDLSVKLPALRTRSWTLNKMVRDIQFMCLENASGTAGTGMSGQISVASILQAIARARNRFVLDTHLPLTVHSAFAPVAPPDGLVSFPQASVFVHRVSWQDSGGAWTTLWREDSWAEDHADPTWTTSPTSPRSWSEAELAPLSLQLMPSPQASGALEALTVDSLDIDITDPNATFNVPDEWVHAVKYAALSDMFSAESQNKDPLRAQYAEQRYQQSIAFAKDARSIIRLLSGNVPLPSDSMAALDAGAAYWRNQSGPPLLSGILYDIAAFAPGVADQTYGVTADVVRSAPLPTRTLLADPSNYLQLGEEDIDNLIDYVTHVLAFKCGGTEFTSTIPGYDGFMGAVAGRKGINAAKIRYFTPLFGQAQKEWAERPDKVASA